ncbi:MAG TPA: NYN domain-containing protein [Terriglobales bacterium]|nr:NYN domain-containing protein [Terriglobales bacterium]
MNEEKLKIAVFIDFDNIQIGVRSTLSRDFDLALVLEALKERGEVVTKIAYGNWKRAGELTRTLTQNAVLMVQRDLTPRGDKNGADINLALDALEMAINHPHINAFVIVGGDSDFIALVEKLKQYNKAVFVVGGRSFTSSVLQRNCREFLAYENLVEASPAGRRREEGARRREVFPLTRAVPLVYRGLKVLADREVQAQLGLLKSTLIQLDSTFNERDFGASSFRAFIQKMADAQLLTLRQQGNSSLVEPLEREPGADAADAQAGGEASNYASNEASNEASGYANGEAGDFNGEGAYANPGSDSREAGAGLGEARSEASGEAASDGGARPYPPAYPPYAPPPAPVATRPPEEALELLQQILAPLKGTNPRPLYLRNVKQLLRTAAPSFDEQQHGFASLVDLLRAGQSQNWLRLQRDRRGALRVFIPPSGGAIPEAGPEMGTRADPGEEGPRADAATAEGNRGDSGVPAVSGAEDEDRQPAFADAPAPRALAAAAPPTGAPEPEDSQIALLGYYDGIHGEKSDEAELSLAAAVADSGGRKKRGPRKPKSDGGAPARRRKPGPKR